MSPPARGRGSKLRRVVHGPEAKASPPARGRGSKPRMCGDYSATSVVAPCAGAWVETPGLRPA